MNNMKNPVVKVPFFINNDNMEFLLMRHTITNLDEVHKKMLFQNGTDIFIPREKDPNSPKIASEYPNQSDTVVAKAIRYIDEDGKKYLLVELIDSLYYHKINEPCIKINGYCKIEEDENGRKVITITKVTRLTLADAEPYKIIG